MFFPSEWYKIFKYIITPLLKSCFKYILGGGKIPVSWNQALNSLISKSGKDKTERSYRPISVLNIDYRIFATISAKRREPMLPKLIDTDQTGFVKNRQTHDTIRRALHQINYIKNIESIVLSLDTEKAFDSVRCEFLYRVFALWF